MSIPHARKITVLGKVYQWSLRSAAGKDRYSVGWTPSTLKLTIQCDGAIQQYLCRSKHWTPDHEEEWQEGGGMHNVTPHKVVFGPRDVRKVIESNGTCDLKDWKVSSH